MEKKDFFISHASVDKEYANWIATTLERKGYSTIIDTKDFHPTQNFVSAMNKATIQAKRTIAVLSTDYFQAQYTEPEWTTAFTNDPKSEKGLLILVKIRPVELSGILKPILYIDLVDLLEVNKEEARKRLLNGIQKIVNDGRELNEEKSAFNRSPEYLLGLLNRKSQLTHFDDQIPERKPVSEGRSHGFCLIGPRQEWPNAIRFKLSHLLEVHKIQNSKKSPEIRPLEKPTINLSNKGIGAEKTQEAELLALGEAHLWKLLAHRLGCDSEKSAILKVLQNTESCHIFYRELTSEEVRNQALIVGMLSAWSKLTFGSNAPSHFLLIICESDYLGNSFFNRIFLSRSASRWHQKMKDLLSKYDLPESLLPLLNTPAVTVSEDVEDWFKDHSIDENQRSIIRKTLVGHSTIPLGKLKEKLFPILQNNNSQ